MRIIKANQVYSMYQLNICRNNVDLCDLIKGKFQSNIEFVAIKKTYLESQKNSPQHSDTATAGTLPLKVADPQGPWQWRAGRAKGLTCKHSMGL